MAYKNIAVRLPDHILDALPPASITGERSTFIREAVIEKLEREEKPKKTKRKAAAK